MRRWLTATAPAASEVADRSSLWLPGALGWMVTVGWLALVLGVAQPPTIAELTFLGAGIFTSGAWPWNGVAIWPAPWCSAWRSRWPRWRRRSCSAAAAQPCADVRRRSSSASSASCRCSWRPWRSSSRSPVAPGEINAPETDGAPLLRMLVALGPFARRDARGGGGRRRRPRRRHPVGRRAATVRGARCGRARELGRAGTAAIAQVLALLVARIGYLVLAAILLRVLWAPIDARLAEEGFGLAVILLLVGFVAIWLCLVLAGGALHAWGSVSWTRILDARGREAGAVAQMESRSRP